MAIQGIRPGIRGRGSYNVDVKLEGDIFKFNFLTNNVNILLATAAMSAQHKFASNYKKKIKENILNGGKRFHYPPHSPAYRKWKTKSGGPSRLLYWGGTMANSVIIKVTGDGTKFSVGIEKGVKRSDYPGTDNNRLTVSEYANVLEHGRPSVGLPARPVFADTFKEHMGGLKGLKKAMELGIIKQFGKTGIIVNKI